MSESKTKNIKIGKEISRPLLSRTGKRPLNPVKAFTARSVECFDAARGCNRFDRIIDIPGEEFTLQ